MPCGLALSLSAVELITRRASNSRLFLRSHIQPFAFDVWASYSFQLQKMPIFFLTHCTYDSSNNDSFLPGYQAEPIPTHS